MNAEKNLVTKEMLADPKCLNVILGGGELKGSLGYKCVVNEDGEYMMVDKNNDEYPGFMTGRICINKDGKMMYIKSYELHQYIDKGWKKGTIYESPGKDKIWVYNNFNDEIERKQILKKDLQLYLDEGWKKGFKKATVNGRICMVRNKEIRYIYKKDLQLYLDEGWERKTLNGYVWITDGTKCLRLPKDDIQPYLDKGWKKGKKHAENNRIKVLIYDLNGNLIYKFDKVGLANKAGFNNLHKYANIDKVYQNKYIIKYEKEE